MKKLLKLAAVAVALTMSLAAVAEAQGGGGGGGGNRGGGQGRGGGRGGATGQMTAEGVSADSAYNILMSGITLDATKKAAVMQAITKFQTDIRALPARGGGAGRGGQRGGGAGMDSAQMAAMQAANARRNEVITAFRTEVKKHLTEAQGARIDSLVPLPGQGGRGRGGGGGI